jgi:hypothetical protein
VAAEYSPDVFRNLVFSAHLESETIIQNANASMRFDEARQGFSISFQAKDAGHFHLIVALQWIHANSEPSEEPIPLVVGSHISHNPLPCDRDRSEIADSRSLLITVKKRSAHEADLIAPSAKKQVQCTSMLEEGRWLQALDADEPCRPPFCTGDRNAARLTNSTW